MTQLNITIMGHAYKLSCKDGEEAVLEAAARYLDEKMCAIRDNGKIKGTDKIAVMAALGIAADLMTQPETHLAASGDFFTDAKKKITALHQLIDQAFIPQDSLFQND